MYGHRFVHVHRRHELVHGHVRDHAELEDGQISNGNFNKFVPDFDFLKCDQTDNEKLGQKSVESLKVTTTYIKVPPKKNTLAQNNFSYNLTL